MSSLPISTEAIGKLRLWLRHATERQQALEDELERNETRQLVSHLLHRGSELGRQRALKRLDRRLEPYCLLEIPHSKDARALWSTIAVYGDDIVVEYLIVSPTRKVGRGPWSFETTAYAVGRFFQRGGDNADVALIEANYNASKGQLWRLPQGEDVLVEAGPGAFLGHVKLGGYSGTEIVQGKTWLHRDQLSDAQEAQLNLLEAS
jgi:hypothetical protein